MTIINPNSIAGITSVTAQADVMNFYRSNGTLGSLQLNGCNFNTATGISTFNNLVVGGTLTYEDVKNVDSVGIITARGGLNVTANTDTDTLNVSGISTFAGDVSIADKIIHTGDTNTVIRFPTADTITAETGGSERFRIDSTGIGTFKGNLTFGANSKAKLFENGNQQGIQCTHSGSSAHLMTHDGAEDIHVDPSGYIKVEVAGTERIRINNSGHIGIGTDTPDAPLEIYNHTTSGNTVLKKSSTCFFDFNLSNAYL